MERREGKRVRSYIVIGAPREFQELVDALDGVRYVYVDATDYFRTCGGFGGGRWHCGRCGELEWVFLKARRGGHVYVQLLKFLLGIGYVK
jgi:hypothetical protein